MVSSDIVGVSPENIAPWQSSPTPAIIPAWTKTTTDPSFPFESSQFQPSKPNSRHRVVNVQLDCKDLSWYLSDDPNATDNNDRPLRDPESSSSSSSFGELSFNRNATTTSNNNLVWAYGLLPQANQYGYVSLHFETLYLPKGTSLLFHGIKANNEPDVFFNLSSLFQSGTLHKDVYAPPILTQQARIELYKEDNRIVLDAEEVDLTVGTASSSIDTPFICEQEKSFGFKIDMFLYRSLQEESKPPKQEAICAGDDSKEAICYYLDEKTRMAYLASRTVARLLIEKGKASAACTGWLIGSESHLITNNHCIKDDAEAQAVTVEFMADSALCNDGCKIWGACKGQVEAISATVLHTNEELDYTLLKLHTSVDLSAKYGFLRLKDTPGKIGQQIYIPQHPLHYGKRIAMVDDFGQPLSITNTSAHGCDATGYSYPGDTQGGSSGSPVISTDDHGVIALHHCGAFCANTGIPANKIVADMRLHNVLPPNAIDHSKRFGAGDEGTSIGLSGATPTSSILDVSVTSAKQNMEFFPPYVPPPVRQESKPIVRQLMLNGSIKRTGTVGISIDQIEFTLSEDADVVIDIMSAEVSDDGVYTDLNGDCNANYLDSVLFLFKKSIKNPLLVIDDSDSSEGTDDGSISIRDPYVQTFLKKGTYLVAIASVPATSEDAYRGKVIGVMDQPEIYQCMDHSDIGSYRVTISSSKTLKFGQIPRNVTIPKGCSMRKDKCITGF
jgi:hypothetical protein